ncbi:uncharacterized protein K444DRAFT_698489 [Hyaloscypha bicolor E]|uniref:Uncharacterized protein n=1 Tax=Hyaloscypha bicolor E TaxID=1095630 RepID=A0A2J6TU64_9HELO|nr:uncharacterized protein K444DRAFT_698489 [Hyaloscypha bicolor E]PMD66569.1 hypothetical protein K444DRAFT_698489 [Hyaloscypha bicolor E]
MVAKQSGFLAGSSNGFREAKGEKVGGEIRGLWAVAKARGKQIGKQIDKPHARLFFEFQSAFGTRCELNLFQIIDASKAPITERKGVIVYHHMIANQIPIMVNVAVIDRNSSCHVQNYSQLLSWVLSKRLQQYAHPYATGVVVPVFVKGRTGHIYPGLEKTKDQLDQVEQEPKSLKEYDFRDPLSGEGRQFRTISAGTAMASNATVESTIKERQSADTSDATRQAARLV